MLKLNKLSSFSAYARPEAHLTRQTTHGAIVTIIGVILGLVLTSHEVSWFFSGKGTVKMAVDLARRHDLNIKVDVTFPAVPCAGLSVDVLDASGTSESDVSSTSKRNVHLHKERLDAKGGRIRGKGAEYVTPVTQQQMAQPGGSVMSIDIGAAMQQMGDMETEMTAHEGCRLHGDVQVRRVAGRLHFAVHQQSFLDILPQMLTGHQLPRLTNMSHVVHKLSFGPEYPGQLNPLDGFSRIVPPGGTLMAYRYFLKIVPTNYFTRMGLVLETSQYSVGEYAMPVTITSDTDPMAAPAARTGGATVRYPYVDISYDLSPIIMTINQSPASLLHFLVRLCAVVGGVLSVTRMLDMAVHAVFKAYGFTAFTPRTSTAGGASEYRGGSYGGAPRISTASGLPTVPSYTGARNRNSSYAGSLGGAAPGSPVGRFGSAGGAGSFAVQDASYTSQASAGSYRSMGSHGGGGPSPLQPQGSFGGAPLQHQGSFQALQHQGSFQAPGLLQHQGSFPAGALQHQGSFQAPPLQHQGSFQAPPLQQQGSFQAPPPLQHQGSFQPSILGSQGSFQAGQGAHSYSTGGANPAAGPR